MEINNFLEKLGYVLKENVYEKIYNNYRVSVNASTYKINYGGKIRYDRETCLNLLHQAETKVVFQCVDALLSMGYNPNQIILEKAYPSGRKLKGQFLDILVLNNDKPFLMIECKTYAEFNNELAKMEAHGGQLFTYYSADANVKYLCLYTSWFDETNKLNYISHVIDTKDIDGSSKEAAFNSWNKTFEKNGIFEQDCIPYQIEFKGLKKANLKSFSLQDVEVKSGLGTIFNRFAEILRRNSISDKNNAYNKIFNLFLCKIVDEEERDENENLWFQWRECETDEEVLSRLSDLYKRGMEKYLNLNISDYSEEELSELLESDEVDSSKIFEMFRKLRLYKNNEFAFNEVINERTFKENAKIVKEVVNLLENYQIKYSSKHQFLGDFFEKLLNIGVKQESGQFFTPIPIANFIVNSIPFEKIIKDKISKGNDNFLPYTIDYACGSGHFLTESMHRINKLFLQLEKNLINLPQKKNYKKWEEDYAWAKEFIYGIELDYRLAKTTKVACYLNGDGDANIVYANGLDGFNSNNYVGILKKDAKNNENFDVVVANPPYSVADFMKTTKNVKDNFILSKYMKETSDNIELLFIERTYQLLKEGGYCGIILPDTILVNDGKVYNETRKFLLENFVIHAIVHLGEQTFIKTGQSTIILFMQKRKTSEIKSSYKSSQDILKKALKNVEVNSVLVDFIKDIYGMNDVDLYLKEIKNVEVEQFKLQLYILSNKKILVCRTGKKQDEILFLGYKHTDRRNYEGIKPYPENDANKIISKLYNDDNIFDCSKLSFYIYNKYLGKEVSAEILKENNLDKNVSIVDLNSIIIYPDINHDDGYSIITKERSEIYYDPQIFEQKPLREIAKENIDGGESAPSPKYFFNSDKKTEIFIRAQHLNRTEGNNIKIGSDNYFTKDKCRRVFKRGTIVFPKSGQSVNTNNIAILPTDCNIVNHLAGIYIQDEMLRDYVFYILKHYGTSNFKLTDTGYPTIKISSIRNACVPVPKKPKDLEKIIGELNGINRAQMSKSVVFEQEKNILKKYKILYK